MDKEYEDTTFDVEKYMEKNCKPFYKFLEEADKFGVYLNEGISLGNSYKERAIGLLIKTIEETGNIFNKMRKKGRLETELYEKDYRVLTRMNKREFSNFIQEHYAKKGYAQKGNNLEFTKGIETTDFIVTDAEREFLVTERTRLFVF